MEQSQFSGRGLRRPVTAGRSLDRKWVYFAAGTDQSQVA